jgi:Protein of unknown function (DUF3037)
MAYKFSLIRFVPDPARGEFVNIGAIAGDDEARDWEVRTISNHRRAKALDERGAWAAALGFVAGLDDRVAALDERPGAAGSLTVGELERLATEMQNIVQLTPPAPVVADSAEQALDRVFDHLIVDPARAQFRFEKKHRAQRAAREAYRAHDVPSSAVRERARIVSGPFDHNFDFAVHNGRALQLVHCWSFQLPNQDDLAEQVKAWSWVVHEIRRNAGQFELESGVLEVPSRVEIFAVTIGPGEHMQAAAYEEARAAFAENDVEELTPERAESLGVRAAELLGSTA